MKKDSIGQYHVKTPLKVAILLFHDIQLLDVSGPAEVLSVANAIAGNQLFELHYLTTDGNTKVRTSAGVSLQGVPFSSLPNDMKFDLLIVPGSHPIHIGRQSNDHDFIHLLETLVARSSVKASVCTGCFFLAKIGFLSGRKVTTHWDALETLKVSCPEALIQNNVLYVEDDDLWSSAGILSGVDMMLSYLVKHVGKNLALAVARTLVVYLVREGGQTQFSSPMSFQTKASEGSMVTLIAWLESNLHLQLTMEQMAKATNTSLRNLNRKCKQSFNLTPGQLLLELRLERSRKVLELRKQQIKTIAIECGFKQTGGFSKAFRKRYGISPSEYRERFLLE
ncbi:GlxA family transcriptional regulator [Bacterioplanoides sp.]|uniref:GlxA family transcriptional regulator n=1 Tax=Bacterioplanoides sp. TaxID=2066072 RepID=UPI003B59113C